MIPSYAHLGWLLHFDIAHHPTVTLRSNHIHDYTAILSSIPWWIHILGVHHTQLLLPQKMTPPLKHHHPNSDHDKYFKLPTTQYKTYYSNIALLPTSTAAATSLAYLPALTTKFRRWIRTRRSCSYHQYRSLPPRPATSDKNLLRPP